MTDDVKRAPRKRINSKKKGSSYEGHVGKLLEEALSPLKFRRSQSSGAILGGVNDRFLGNYSDEARSLFVGDVVPTNEADVLRDHGWKFRFTIECKFYKTADQISHLLDNTKIIGWFEQARRDAEKIGKEPLLIFKFNRTDEYCAVDKTQTEIPRKISRTVTLEYNRKETDGKVTRDTFTIMLFKEALQDNEWFKKYIHEVNYTIPI